MASDERNEPVTLLSVRLLPDDGSLKIQEKEDEEEESFHTCCDNTEQTSVPGKTDTTQEKKPKVSLTNFPDDMSGVIKERISKFLEVKFDGRTSTDGTNILVAHDEKRLGNVLSHLKEQDPDINLHLKQCAERGVLLILIYPENSDEDDSILKSLLEKENSIAQRDYNETGVQTNEREELKQGCNDLQDNMQVQNEGKVYLKIFPHMVSNETMEKDLVNILQRHCDFERCSSESFTNILVLRSQGRYMDELEIIKIPIEKCRKQSVLLVIIHPEHSAGMPSTSDIPEIAGTQLHEYILGTYHLFSKDNMVETPKNHNVLSHLGRALANQVGRKNHSWIFCCCLKQGTRRASKKARSPETQSLIPHENGEKGNSSVCTIQ